MVNKLWIFFIVMMLVSASCYHENHPQVEIPEHQLSKKQMVDILTDVYLAEGAITYHRMNKTLTEEKSAGYFKLIFDEHHITHRILKDNLRYYNASPEEMEKIMEDVLANLSKLQAEVMAMKDPANDTIPGQINDTLPSRYIPSLLYQEVWSYASLIDSLLFIPVDTVANRLNDSTFNE